MAQLRSYGPAEAELVKKYRFSKINGIKTDNQNDSELNLMLVSTLKQLVVGSSLGDSEGLIDEVLIPALILADK
jgi:hypothetical protein